MNNYRVYRVKQARQAVVVKSQQPVVRGDLTPLNIGAVEKRKKEVDSQRMSNTVNYQPCSNSGGRWPHDRQNYPEKNAVCHRCKKRGHFQHVCRSSAAATANVRGVSTESQ